MHAARQIIGLIFIGLVLVSAWPAHADSLTYGLHWSSASWREPALDAAGRGQGTFFGPLLIYRFGDRDIWSTALDIRHGDLGRADRRDVRASFSYRFTRLFAINSEYIQMRYRIAGRNGDPFTGNLTTRGTGVGLGLSATTPLFGSDLHLVSETGVTMLSMRTDGPPGNGTTYAWRYHLGLRWRLPVKEAWDNVGMYLAGGIKSHRLRGGGFRERLRTPYAELGFTQRF